MTNETYTDAQPIRIFLGYDRRLPIVSQVAVHSMQRHASRPLSITQLVISALQRSQLMTRPLQGNQSTEFSFSRFLVPYLSGYDGWVIFMDNDIVVQADIAKLWSLRDDRYAVMCVQHDHNPTEDVKFLGQEQAKYQKKNWSSVMLINTAKCKALTPEYVNTASGLDLHRFHWLESDDLIGALPPEWNFLIDYSVGDPADQNLLHYTDGGPYYEAYTDCQAAHVWLSERDHMLNADTRSLAEAFPQEFCGATSTR